jgi:lipopolysaccharide heptosyltransferase I
MPKDGHPRILVSRLSAIGDCILTLPLLCALRRAMPDAMLAWVVQSAAAKILESHECLDEVIVVQRRWLKSPKQVWNLRRRLRGLQVHISIDAQSLFKSAAAAWLSGAERRIGFGPPLGRELSYRLNNEIVHAQSQHIVDKHLELLGPLGLEPKLVEFRLPSFAAESAFMSVALRELGLQTKRFAVLNPGGAWASKRWPPERFSQLASMLGQRLGIRSLVVWSGEEELRWATDIAVAAAPYAVMAPPTNLRELTAVLRQAAFFVGGDTGPLHIAAATGTSCVSLHGTTNAKLSHPYGPQHIALQKYYQAGSAHQRRNAANDAMRAIHVAEVFHACGQAWSALNKRSAA